MWDIARLNVLLELFSECAGIADLDTLLHAAAGRLRWVIDFDQCTFAVLRKQTCVYWMGTRADETLRPVAQADLVETQRTLIGRVLDTGAPTNLSTGAMCVPLQVAGQTLGAIYFSTHAGIYTYRDMRLGHHAGQYLGALVSRMDLEDEAKRMSERKDDLLALLSHELRNPLAPIVTAVELLRLRSDGRDSRELDIIARQAQHLIRLVDDLLDVARLTRGKVMLERAPVELAQVVARAVEMVSPLFEQRRHSLVVDVPRVGLVLDADENRLAQVLSNLLNNAAHYTAGGGHISVTARRAGSMVIIDVADDGIGIAPDTLPHVFDLFVQGAARSSGPGGLGLGLVVVQQLTTLHGGSVSVASSGHGCGTTFTLELPVLPIDFITPATAATLPSVAPADTPQRVLLIDDNRDALDLLSEMLKIAGHQVVMADNGPEALAMLDRFHPSVAVIDLSMPVMDGYEVAARIRAGHGGDSVYLLALTGYGQASDRERTRVAGFDEHLVKPVDLPHLLHLVAHPPNRSVPGLLSREIFTG